MYEGLSACISVHCLHMWCPWWPKEGIRVLGAGVIECCELLHEYWKSIPDLLEEHPGLLTVESFLQP